MHTYQAGIVPEEADDENLQMIVEAWQARDPEAHSDMLWIIEYASLDMDDSRRQQIRRAIGITV